LVQGFGGEERLHDAIFDEEVEGLKISKEQFQTFYWLRVTKAFAIICEQKAAGVIATFGEI